MSEIQISWVRRSTTMQHACSTVSSERGKSTLLVGERGSPQHCTAGYRWMQAWWLTRPAFNQVRGLTWFAHAISPQKHSFNSCQFFVQFWMSTELHDVQVELSFDLSLPFKGAHCEIVWHCLKLNFGSFYFSLFIEQCSVPSAYFEPSLTVLTL